MEKFIDRYNITEDNWSIMTTHPDTLRSLADLLEVQYKVIEGETISYFHTNFVAIINQNGQITQTDRGFRAEITKLVRHISKLLRKYG